MVEYKTKVGKCKIDVEGGVFVNDNLDGYIHPNELEQFQEIIKEAILIRDEGLKK